VAAVGVLYLAVRRWAGPAAGLLAGACLAVTPVATLMFRFNNPDALLVLLLTLGAYATVRAIDDGSTRWAVLAGAFVGFGFLAKMLQAFLVVPGFGLAYLVAAPGNLLRRAGRLALAGVALVAAAGWWVAIVELWPASSRPYIGGSQSNSVLDLVFGYNGFGRLTGDESGSVGGGAPGTAGRWGETGILRLFNDAFGGQASWLLPAALVLLVALLVATWRAPRTDRTRAAAVLWGSWLLVTGLAISLGQGIIHEYYTVALAPAIGALVGIGAVYFWRLRRHVLARVTLAAAIGVTAWWAATLLARTPDWAPALRPAVLVGGALAAALTLLPPMGVALASATAVVALAVALVGPAAFSWATASVPHRGAIPTAGPATGVGPGRGGGPLVTGPFRPGGGGTNTPNGMPAAPPQAGGPPGGLAGAPPGPMGGGTGPATAPGTGTGPGATGQPSQQGRAGGAGVGGILDASEPSAELTAMLREDAGEYRWAAAVVSANQAAGYQLASGHPVMAIGGFNGTDPSPTLEEFQEDVAAGRIHWFIGRGSGFSGAGATEAERIAAWVSDNFAPITVDGVTVYDLAG
jgi:Dolichyl-phosphate-mannose-protein mannosyltransferase